MVVCEVLGEAAGDVGAAGLQDGCEACGAGGLHGDELVSLHLLLGDKMMLEDSPYIIIIIIIIISPRCLLHGCDAGTPGDVAAGCTYFPHSRF